MKRYLYCLIVLISIGLYAQEIPIRQSFDLSSSQINFSCPDGDIIFWTENPDSHRDVYAQKIMSDGSSLWPEAALICSDPEDQVILGGVPSSDGGFILLIGDIDRDIIHRIFMLKISQNGDFLWPQSGIVVQTGEFSIGSCKAVANSSGGAFVVWSALSSSGLVYGNNYDTAGNPLWNNGRILCSHNGSVELSQAISDGEGAMILNIKKWYGDIPRTCLKRISASGTQIGAEPLVNPAIFPNQLFEIGNSTNGTFILWQVQSNENLVRYYRIDNMGILQGASSQTQIIPNGSEAMETRVCPTPDGGLAILWAGWTAGLEVGFKLYKLDADLGQQWVVNLEHPGIDYLVYGVDLIPNQGGYLWVAWSQELHAYGHPQYAQLVSPDGQLCWGIGGIQLYSTGGAFKIIPHGDRALFVSRRLQDGNEQLRYQIYLHNGSALLSEGGVLVSQLMFGGVYEHKVISLGDKYLLIWRDTRQERSLYFQIVDQQNNNLLEDMGRHIANSQDLYGLAKVNESSVALWISVLIDGLIYDYLQVIDSNGNFLYPGNGIQISYSAEFGIQDRCLSSYGGDIYASWKQSSSVYSGMEMRAQRFSNGQVCWEENGKLLLSLPLSSYYKFYGFTGRYLLWVPEYSSTAKVLYFDNDANPDPLWDPAGMNLVHNTTPGYSYEIIDIGFDNEDLIVAMQLSMPEGNNIQLQRITPQGIRLWSDQGHQIPDPGLYPNLMDVHFGPSTSYLLSYPGDPYGRILLQKVNEQGDCYFPEPGMMIQYGLHSCQSAQLFSFLDGNWLCVWSSTDGQDNINRDIYYRVLSSDCVPLGTEPGVICGARYPQDLPVGAVIGNNVFVAWKDNRSGVEHTERIYGKPGLWGRQLNSQSMSGYEIDHPTLSLNLKPNYPNPFNPITTIPFYLSCSGVTSLEIFNLRGQKVKNLLKDEFLLIGEHQLNWNGTDDKGNSVGSGVYLYRITQGERSSYRRMLLLK